ncbi:MAG TPA: helix-turn-helix transcriptional regulator [Chloroflexota bacterium]|nr:helix-turn-helix transcriptional regulator [Chloroflexota bacterium]
MAPEPSGAGPPPARRLTPREREAARLLVHGLTNRQLGRELVISAGTAVLHGKRILHKLDLPSHVQLAALLARMDGATTV